MTLPSPATKVHLDAATDDPRQARTELAALVDALNGILTHLGLSTITSTPATVGEGLEIATGALRAKLNGSTLLRSGSGLSVNVGAGANLIPQLDGSGKFATGTFATTLNAEQQFRRSGVITPSQITGNQNNYAPSGITTASRIRVSSDAARNITGLSGGAEGREIRLTNIGSFTITLTDADTDSDAANRFLFGADFELLAGKSVNLFYDDTLDRWLTDDAGSSAGGGAWDVLEEQTASNSASLDFVLTSYLTDYEDFEFIVHQLLPASDGVDLYQRTSTNGGSSYDAGASDYAWMTSQHTANDASTTNAGNGDNEIKINAVAVIGNVAGEGFSGRMTSFFPGAAAEYRSFWWGLHKTTAGVYVRVNGSGARLTAADVDAIRFLFSSGNIASGKITLLGRRKAS